MALGLDILLKLVKEQNLVENLADRELSNPEGAGFDLRAGELYELRGPGYLGIESRETSPAQKIASYDENPGQRIVIPKGAYYLVKTLEWVNMPEDIEAWVSVRSTLFRCGVHLDSTKVNAGYRGALTFGLNNAGSFDFTLEMGSRIAHISFEEIQGGGRAYRGQWQGGRVSTEGVEKQT
jgi:deoxycytidine triphosphate deaminase